MPDSQLVKNLFKAVAPRYDRLNTLLSGGQDTLWRQAVARAVAATGARNVLDLATGSGRLAFDIARQYQRQKMQLQLTGYDFCPELLAIAKRDSQKHTHTAALRFEVGDALSLPLPDGNAQAITVAFGLRNFEDRSRAYAEALRLLAPGGHYFILEFTQPRGLMRALYHAYQPFIPLIAKLTGAPAESYQYLNDTINSFPDAPALVQELQRAGFERVKYRCFSWGVVALHQGQKPR
jgi:demethylmenaquinone methyltransferase / 2-methoxy-6-polyprenyl-1,4-benzoquinol methylase